MKKITSLDGRFHDGNPATGQLGTIVTAEWLNDVQADLVNNDSSHRTDLISLMRSGRHSNELFTVDTGINEFDLLYEAGNYHLFYDDKTGTKHRQAATLAGLSAADDDLAQVGYYPSAQVIDGVWHLWTCDVSFLFTNHYTAPAAAGPYVFHDAMPANRADVHVRRSPLDGLYYATYKEMAAGINHLKAGALRSASPNGPWVDLGYIFDDIGRACWHSLEEADPAALFFAGRAYVAFSGWDGTRQRVALVEVDPVTFKAFRPAVVIVEPNEAWQQRNGAEKVFNPVFLSVPLEGGRARLYYSQNPGAAVTAGWAYVEAALPEKDTKPGCALNMDWMARQDVSTNLRPTFHGSFLVGPDGITLNAATGGVYGHAGFCNAADFTMLTEFTVTTLPGAGVYAKLCGSQVRSNDKGTISLWLLYNKIYAQVKHATPAVNPVVITGGTVITTGVRYRVSLRRLGDAVTLYLNQVVEGTGTKNEVITGMEEMNIGNAKGSAAVADQQFIGTIHKCQFFLEALPVTQM